MTRTRIRIRKVSSANGKSQFWNGNIPTPATTVLCQFYDSQSIMDEIHPGFRRLNQKTSGKHRPYKGKHPHNKPVVRQNLPATSITGGADIGGPLLMGSSETIIPGGKWCSLDHDPSNPSVQYCYNGPIYAYQNNVVFKPSDVDFYITPSSSDSVMNGYGVTGVARAIPTNPLSGMGQFLGELRDLPKAPLLNLWRDKAHYFRNLKKEIGNEYLNVQFGWVPFVNDLRSFAKTVKNHNQVIDDYARNSGHDVRRGATVSHTTTTTIQDLGLANAAGPFNVYMVSKKGRLKLTRIDETRIWFRGAFTYYLPSDDTKLGKLKRYEALAHKLFGLRLDPDLLWKLAPWSWAADWIGNVGDNVHNWSAFQNDGLVMRYGYIMEEKSSTFSYSLEDFVTSDGEHFNLNQVFRHSRRKRVRATPYGFGLNPSTFSAKQWSIIAALGLSKGPRLLN